RLQTICSAPQMHVFVVRDSENIIGMATLEVGETMLGTQGYVHDVVVSSAYRGKGIGKMLMEKIIAEAKELAVRHIDLTSNPKRNTGQFYTSLGFVKRETDCYRKELANR
ncbi:MAG: GNAT family N-acetyltransferase, partial [Candidatus Harrisonbacteria bacterium]|nr:GNAT family N-acetyltransferase [Candidatus Harrisonbacteria bacterium]